MTGLVSYPPRITIAAIFTASALAAISSKPLLADSIDTGFIEQAWPKQQVRHLEVSRYGVTWRQRASKTEGIFAGARFPAAAAQETVWALATDYSSVGAMTPGVSAVTVLEETPVRQVIQIDVKVLWKPLRLLFEIEQDRPRAVRFRLTNPVVGEYRGALLLKPDGPQSTQLELVTWLRPGVRLPQGLILGVERMVLLQGIRHFISACEEESARIRASTGGGHAALDSGKSDGKLRINLRTKT